jgi:ABC-type transport system substrate-binding protein
MLNYSAKKKFFAFSKWPSRKQWGQFFKILTKKEKGLFLLLVFLFSGSLLFLGNNFYFKNTKVQPAEGGTFTQGVVGQPRFINPIYSSANDPDRDLVELIFSGLMKYDENGNLVYDLAQEIKTEPDGKTYRVFLKDNVFWSDSNSNSIPFKLTADDVVYTIETIQNSDYKSPLRANWLGVEVEKINDLEIVFKLKNPYSAFLENLTLKILPKHIWQDVSYQNFPLSIYNQKPIGSGPYRFGDFVQDNFSGYIKSVTLKINSKYFGKKPNLEKINFVFFKDEEELISSVKKGEINGFSLSFAENESLVKDYLFQSYHFSMPRYFAVFFNPDKSKPLAEIKVRQALNYGTNKQEIINQAINSDAIAVDSPILPEIYGFAAPEKKYQFDLEKAKSLLDEAGYKETESGIREKTLTKQPAFQFKSNLQSGSSGTEVEELQKCLAKYPDVYPSGEVTGSFGAKTKEAVINFQEKYADEILKPSGLTKGTGTVLSSTRKKLNELCAKTSEEKTILKISLTTINQPTMVKVADILRSQWKALGVEMEIKIINEVSTLEKETIKSREYESILFGEVLGKNPDPFPFWHSSQKKDPGLNLAIYDNKEADKLLEEARQALNDEERNKKLENFQNIVIADAPCVFLYSPDYIYFVSKEIKGIQEKMITDPSKIFTNIENWYIKIKRAWK